MHGMQDPLRVLLHSVRVVGDEYCWPATDVMQVLEAFALLNRVVQGAELWRFDDASSPTVVGWTEYEVPEGTWRESVERSSRLASDELLGHAGDLEAWVNVTWKSLDGN